MNLVLKNTYKIDLSQLYWLSFVFILMNSYTIYYDMLPFKLVYLFFCLIALLYLTSLTIQKVTFKEDPTIVKYKIKKEISVLDVFIGTALLLSIFYFNIYQISNRLILIVVPIYFMYKYAQNNIIKYSFITYFKWFIIVSYSVFLINQYYNLPTIVVPHTDSRVYHCTLLISCQEINTPFRFNAIYDEPGTFACIIAMIITFLWGVMPKVDKLFFIFIGLTTSSLFFVVYIVIFLLLYYTVIKFSKFTILIIGGMFLTYIFAEQIVNIIDNRDLSFFFFNRFILNDHGLVVGIVNNRTNALFSDYYNSLNLWHYLFGFRDNLQHVYLKWTGLSYRNFIVELGMISLVYIVLAYFYYCYKKIGVKITGIIFIFFALYFYQRPLFFRPEMMGFSFFLMNILNNYKKKDIQ